MAELTIKQKKELAEILYTKNNLSQKEVAAHHLVGVSTQTMSKWVRDGGWDKLKVSITLTREQQLQRLYMQISEYNTAIESRPQGQRFATAKEADAINKLAAAIDKLERETGIREILDVSKMLLDYLRKYDLPKAQELSAIFDAFIKDNMR